MRSPRIPVGRLCVDAGAMLNSRRRKRAPALVAAATSLFSPRSRSRRLRPRQVAAARDRQQVILPFAAISQVAMPILDCSSLHPRRFHYPREVLDHFERRVVDRRQTCRQFGSRPAFDAAIRNTAHRRTPYLVVAERAPSCRKRLVTCAGIDPLLRWSRFDGFLEFGDDGLIQRLQDAAHVSVPTDPRRFRTDQRCRKIEQDCAVAVLRPVKETP